MVIWESNIHTYCMLYNRYWAQHFIEVMVKGINFVSTCDLVVVGFCPSWIVVSPETRTGGKKKKRCNSALFNPINQPFVHICSFHWLNWMLFTRLFSSIPSVQFHSIQLQFLPAHLFICCHSKSTCQRQIYFSYILMFFVVIFFFFISAPPSCRRYWTTTVLETFVCSPTKTKRQIPGAFYTKWRRNTFHQAKRQWK